MSSVSDHLHSGQTGAPVGCGETRAEEKACVGGLEGMAGPELWTRELGLQEGSQDPSNDGLASGTPDHFPSSPSALANGLHRQGRLGHSRRKKTDTHPETHMLAETFRNMQTHIDTAVHEKVVSHAGMDNCGHLDIHPHTGSVGPKLSGTLTPDAIRTTSPQPLSVALGNHPASTNQRKAPVLNAETENPSTFCPVPVGPTPNTGSSALPVETEKKYALRSSGRPRFPCHLRKSSRLRRGMEDGEKRAARERGGEEEDEVLEEKIWRVKEEEVAVGEKEVHSSVEAVLPTAPPPTDIPIALTVPKPAPKAVPKPGPRLGHKPGPKSRSRPPPKVQKAAPKSVKQRQAAMAQRAAAQLPFTNTSTIAAASLAVKQEPLPDLGGSGSNNRRRGRFVGVRKIVVKVARIPVNLSRRQKSYKISNMETVRDKSNDCGVDGSEVAREPTALLRMKNNGKSVMVMFPPGEMPVILKRRRGRPPKQPPPGIPAELLNTPNAGGIGDPPKKPQRRRRTKLPAPYPSYVNDTNDVKTEYGDVLSKLAFLNRQPPATGRCSPPRCWTPSEPESFHTPLENPGISTLLHRLTGYKRPRGGRGGGAGRGGGGGAGGVGGNERNKSTFSDFFESIGKNQKMSPLSEHGLPKKRGKGRGGGAVGSDPGAEKTVKRRRVKKNGAFKGEGMSMGQEWPNGAGGWGEGGMDKEKALGGYQFCGSPRRGFSSCEVGRGGSYSSPGGGRGVGLQERTHRACLPDISGPSSTRTTHQTFWTLPPRSQTPGKLHPPLVTSHPVQLPATAGPLHSPSGAPRGQILGWRVPCTHMAPQQGLLTAMAAWPKLPPPLLPIPNPLLHLSHTRPAHPIHPLLAITPPATPPLLLRCHRDPQTAALHMDLARLSVKWVTLTTRQQPREVMVDILQQVIPPWCGGSQQDPHHQEEGTCLSPKAAPSAPLHLQRVTNSTTPVSGATDKVMAAGQQTALGLSITATVNMAPMSPKTSWISQTTLPRRPSDNHFLKFSQNPRPTLHTLALRPLAVDPAPPVAPTN
ncbi:AT-hook DNA-binding motif-containing protein 1 [Dissostichus eleginoides]|uniref:AT-hook DNA-binding motif-containing protein 1 n=1 Tax=Dissostichus eleginoides TaxID=100907 RepID=A0AAD9BAT2_DISEL|nr:AT-hook DNA-binding motif-containing protein 1 [Dissostichus eleginoides]